MVRAGGNKHGDASPHSSPQRISVRRDEDDEGGDQQSSHPPLRLPDAHLRHHHHQYPQVRHDHEDPRQVAQHQQLTRSRSSPSIVLGAYASRHHALHPQSVHLGSSATAASAVYWTQQPQRNARAAASSVHVQQQHYQYGHDQEDVHRAAQDGRIYQHRLDTYPSYQSQSVMPAQHQQSQHGTSNQASSYEMYETDAYEHQHDAARRSFTGKRKASGEGDLTVDYGYLHYDSVHLTLPPAAATTLSPGSDRAASRNSEQQSRAAATEAAAAMQTRRSFPPYPHSPYSPYSQQPNPQSHRRRHTGDSHAFPVASDNSLQQQQQQQRWLRRSEEETKDNHPHQQQHIRRVRSSETSLSPLALAQCASSMTHQRLQQPAAVQRATMTAPPSPEPTLLPPQTRVITNASRNITFAMLQSHFERPLQEAALRFGVCTTLLKNICRKNGIKNWPFRRICGLHKSIASMEKQVHYFDGEQKRSYADQLYKLQLELAAYKRTGNALTEEFQAKVEAEGGLGEVGSTRTTNPELLRLEQQQRRDDHAEAKIEDVGIASSYTYNVDDDQDAASTALSPPTLSAVSTRVSVSSYRYASPTNHDEDHDIEDHENQLTQRSYTQQQQQYASVRQVMAATVDLGYDDTDERQRGRYSPQLQPQHRHAQQRHGHHHHAANPHGSRAAPVTSSARYLVPPQGLLLHRALPSLSFMLHRQSLSQHPSQQQNRADGSSPPPPANPHYYQPS